MTIEREIQREFNNLTQFQKFIILWMLFAIAMVLVVGAIYLMIHMPHLRMAAWIFGVAGITSGIVIYGTKWRY